MKGGPKVQNRRGGGPNKENSLLTKELEDTLITNSKDKVLDCVKTSTGLHDFLDKNGIDKHLMIDTLYQDRLFCY